jgi:hypothetical protein
MRPNVNLDYLIMKTERAKLHLDSLNRELDAYSKDSFEITMREENGRSICRTQWKSMPPIIGMLLGEFLYCLRSGLDQLAWQLALPASRQNKFKDIYFPVVDSVANADKRRNFEKAKKLFPDEVALVIESLQPFKELQPQNHPLWLLNELCNIDKHRIVPINSRALEVFVPHNPSVMMQHFESEDAIEVSVPIADKWQFEYAPNATMNIEFGEWDTDFAVPRSRLTDIHGYFVCTVIPTFQKFIAKAIAKPELRLAAGRIIYQE